MLQIKQLNSIERAIDCNEQKQLHGSGAENLWLGYANGEYDIREDDVSIKFTESGSFKPVGMIGKKYGSTWDYTDDDRDRNDD